MTTATSRQFLDASGITFLLCDHENFGFSERLTYHFDLIETLTSIPQKSRAASITSSGKEEGDNFEGIENSNPALDEHANLTETKINPKVKVKSVCGVVSLLECVSAQTSRQKNQRRHLFRRIKEFNRRANEVRNIHSNSSESESCYAPPILPLQLTFTTRVAFAYELTRMVLCIDASPTLTATFGNLGTLQQSQDNAVCAMDRLENMVRMYFEGLMEPIIGANNFFNSTNAAGRKSDTSWWTPEIAITVIAVYPRALELNDADTLSVLVQDYRVHDAVSASILSDKVADWAALEVESGIASRLSRTGNHLDSSTSSLRCMVEACDIALGTLPSEGRPCIVLATDCRGVDCDSMLDLVQDQNLLDKPLYVLDLSGSASHQTRLGHNDIAGSINEPNYLMFDHDGPSTFPLSFPDDSEALYYACKALRGCFFDETLLRSASDTRAGKVPIDSPFYSDTYFSKERKMQPNALQWYTFFSLSPCCPCNNPLGEVPPPRRLLMPKISQTKPMFLTYYSLSPVRVKGIIIMRIMDGYRLKQYGYNSSDEDKVSIHFTLPLESGVVIHYELSYVAFPNHNPMVGSANVKILVSGNQRLVQSVKDEFVLYQFNLKKPVLSVKQKACDKICRFLNWVKNEDQLESKLCPLEWGGILSEESHFLSNLKGLNRYQRYRHFRTADSFEICLTGNIGISTEPLLSEFMELDNGEHQLYEVVKSWSSFMIKEDNLYIKRLPSGAEDLTSYCLLEVKKSVLARVCTVNLLFFEQVDTDIRISVAESLKTMINSRRELVLAPRLFSTVVSRSRQTLMEAMYHHERWEVLPDPDMVSLLSKRRSQFGKYVLVEDGNSHATFVKFESDEKGRSYLVQYHIKRQLNQVTVEMVMDWSRGDFCGMQSNSSFVLFAKIYEKVKNRDQKCGRALRSRRNLLSVFEENSFTKQYPGDQTEDVKRLLAYSSESCISLRFFDMLSGEANEILSDLTISLLLSNSFDANVVKLAISRDAHIGNTEPGTWLLLRHDSHVLTFIHLPFHEKVSEISNSSLCVYRAVSFFTCSTGGLYYTHDDLADDDSIERNETGHECVADVADALENAHGRNYASAAYLALRHRSPAKSFSFTSGDFQYALAQCCETKITHGVDVTKEDEPKLAALVTDMQLSLVPGGGPYFFYTGNEENYQKGSLDNELISLDSDLHGNKDVCDAPQESLSDSLPTSNINNTDKAFDCMQRSEGPLRIIRNYSVLPPLFMKFDLNDKAASIEDIGCLEKNCKLNAYITIFDDDSKRNTKQSMELDVGTLPTVHTAVITKLESRLNSFRAEQTLENLRREGITSSSIHIVKKCLLAAENVYHIFVPLHFYVAKTDSMLDASVSRVEDGDLTRQFTLLCLNLKKQKIIQMEKMHGAFFAVDTEISGWCCVDVPNAFGFGSGLPIYVYHPAGKERAQCIASKAKDLVTNVSHRVNQILLLENLKETRTASPLLIPSSVTSDTSPASIIVEESSSSHDENMDSKAIHYGPGHFGCPISYRTSYKLNRWCDITQTIIQLESSSLQNFAVSNRRGVFVYKDIHSNIFYMKLQPHPGIDKENDSIELLVHGEQKAGISITRQLNRILGKKIMSLTLEAISRVLTKNRCYNLWPTDITFLRSFQKVWNEKDQTEESFNDERIYEFPSLVYDPIIVLLYFRQNISGSKFFHILNETSTESEEENVGVEHNHIPVPMKDDTDCTSNEVLFTFNPRDFSLCFNASQFQLDPRLQPVSTLTKTGAKFAQKAGTGVALIEIKLLHSNNEQVDKVCIGLMPQKEVEPLQIPVKLLRFRKIDDEVLFEDKLSKFRLSVRIVNTTLNTDVVHKWIELTLNQAHASFAVEQHLKKARLNLFLSSESKVKTKQQCTSSTLYGFRNPYCGLPGLCSILHSSNQLPHPGIQKITFQASVRATTLAKLAFNFLERGIIQPLFNKQVRVSDIAGLKIIRFCGKNKPKQVRFSYDTENGVVHVFDIINNCHILDGSADSPEYICVFGLSPETEKVRRMENETHRASVPSSSFLFQNISIEDLNDKSPGSLSKALIKLNSRPQYDFLRRIAFVLTVTRSSQSVLLYNWNPQTKQSAQARMKEVHEDFLLSYNHKLISLQSRCLNDTSLIRSLSPHALGGESIEKAVSIGLSPSILKRAPSESDSPSKSKKKSDTILMPTIVGNPVNSGSDKLAMERARAIARDRARARAQAPRSTTSSMQSRVHTLNNNNSKAPVHKPKEGPAFPKVKVYEKGVKSKQKMLLENFPSSFLKEYCALQNHLSSTIFLRNTAIHTTQNLFLHRMTNLQGRELSIAAMNFILTHGNLVKTELFSLIQSAVINPVPFIMYLKKSISRSEGLLLSRNFANKKTQIGKVLYTMNKIANSKYYTSYFIHEIAVFRHPVKGLMGRCRSWLLTNSKASEHGKLVKAPTHTQKRNKSVTSSEWESLMINAIASAGIGNLDISGAIFNFVSILLKRTAQKQLIKIGALNIPLLLRESMTVFPPRFQNSAPQLWYRLLHKELVFHKSKLLTGSSNFSIQDLIADMSRKESMYGIVKCEDQDCFAGLVPGSKDLHFFLSIHSGGNQDEISFDMYVLCFTRARWTTEGWFFENGSPHAKRMSQYILDISRNHVWNLLGKAVIDFRRDLLWKKYTRMESKTHEEAADKIYQEVLEMRSISPLSSIAALDPRLTELLIDEENDLDIKWLDAFSSMVTNPFFSCYQCFHMPIDGVHLSVYLVYFKEEDLFLMLELDAKAKFKSGTIMGRNEKKVTENSRVGRLVEEFANFLLLWIYNNS